MQHSGAPGPLPDRRAPVICTGSPLFNGKTWQIWLMATVSTHRPSTNLLFIHYIFLGTCLNDGFAQYWHHAGFSNKGRGCNTDWSLPSYCALHYDQRPTLLPHGHAQQCTVTCWSLHILQQNTTSALRKQHLPPPSMWHVIVIFITNILYSQLGRSLTSHSLEVWKKPIPRLHRDFHPQKFSTSNPPPCPVAQCKGIKTTYERTFLRTANRLHRMSLSYFHENPKGGVTDTESAGRRDRSGLYRTYSLFFTSYRTPNNQV
jgi:hypothetical protein